MVLNIDVNPETVARLRQQAEAAGKDVSIYVSEMIERAAAKPTFDEMLASVRREFGASGIGEGELVHDITEAQVEYRAQKKKTA